MFVGPFLIKTSPENGESLTSWMVRVAHQFSLRPYALCLIMWRGTAILNRDIDGQSNPVLWKGLADANGVDHSIARGTTIASLEGKLFRRHAPNSKTKWVLRLGIFHRSRRRFGQQFCPHCLATDERPFYRLGWRLAFTTVCLKHRRQMLDRCQSCGSAVEFHRHDPLNAPIISCFHCGDRLDRQRSRAAPRSVMELQSFLEGSLSAGHAAFGSTKKLPSVDLLTIYGQLLRIVATGARSQKLRNSLAKMFGLDPAPINFQTNAKEYEALDVENRIRLAALCAPLLLDWPNNFIEACQRSDFWATWALRDTKAMPAEYTQIVASNLGMNAYLSSRDRKLSEKPPALSKIVHIEKFGGPKRIKTPTLLTGSRLASIGNRASGSSRR